jgi:hypothetical protein
LKNAKKNSGDTSPGYSSVDFIGYTSRRATSRFKNRLEGGRTNTRTYPDHDRIPGNHLFKVERGSQGY